VTQRRNERGWCFRAPAPLCSGHRCLRAFPGSQREYCYRADTDDQGTWPRDRGEGFGRRLYRPRSVDETCLATSVYFEIRDTADEPVGSDRDAICERETVVTEPDFHGLTRNKPRTVLNPSGRAGFGSDGLVHEAAGDGRTRGRASIDRVSRSNLDQTRPRRDRCEHEQQKGKARASSHIVGLREEEMSIPAERIAGRLPSASEASRAKTRSIPR
jgi:hypothetical protein